MFNARWHLRRERMIFYQLAMNTCLAAECTATYSLAKYSSLEDNVRATTNGAATVHHNDIFSAQCLTIVSCVLVATIFGADMFFLIFWPRRKYPRWYNITKQALAFIIMAAVAAATLFSTIVVASHSATISGVDAATQQELTEFYYRPPLLYRKWAVNIAYVVVLWVGLVCTVGATVVMFMAAKHEGNIGTGNKELVPIDEMHEKVEGRDAPLREIE
ncbi:hypothetical protein Hypma_005678 [Hypsizygus marmoreus]|uniref:Uncharacterized protein n=1 Tax=Hypsizygus marmoreus TaxID=39966 RepID=A0A369JW53_HYPMA|nr:hypothetical protein Hypma_005678 [Hypsizygus marmoreus]